MQNKDTGIMCELPCLRIVDEHKLHVSSRYMWTGVASCHFDCNCRDVCHSVGCSIMDLQTRDTTLGNLCSVLQIRH